MLKMTSTQWDIVKGQRLSFNAAEDALKAKDVPLNGFASSLPQYVWKDWDREAIEISRDKLVVFNDLASSLSVAQPLGKTVHEYPIVGDNGEVITTFNGEQRSRKDHPKWEYELTAVPLYEIGFEFSAIQMRAAESDGYNIIKAPASNIMYHLADRLETIAITGDANEVYAQRPIYGLTTHPHRIPVSRAGLDLSNATGAQVKGAFSKIFDTLEANNQFDEVMFYMNKSQWRRMTETDYSNEKGDSSIAQKVLQMEGVQGVLGASKVPANTILGVIKQRSKIEVLSRMPLTTIAKPRFHPFDPYCFEVWASGVLEIKRDANNKTGIVHYS